MSVCLQMVLGSMGFYCVNNEYLKRIDGQEKTVTFIVKHITEQQKPFKIWVSYEVVRDSLIESQVVPWKEFVARVRGVMQNIN